MKAYTREELAQFNGHEGRPTYVAHNGIVYDLSGSKRWPKGQHMRRHQAGQDLSADIQAAPHTSDLLDRFPRVGTLAKEPSSSQAVPAWLEWLLAANPFLRRHPHPMTVHFPIAFMLAHPLFILLSLVTGNPGFASTAQHCLGCGILGMAVAVTTGFFTWWYNYLAKMKPAIAIKITLSSVTLALAVILFLWRQSSPDIMATPDKIQMLYPVLSFGLIPLISLIGWFGATLTFPIEKDSGNSRTR